MYQEINKKTNRFLLFTLTVLLGCAHPAITAAQTHTKSVDRSNISAGALVEIEISRDVRIEMPKQIRGFNARLSARGVLPKRADDFFLPIFGRFTGATIHLGLRIKRINVAASPC